MNLTISGADLSVVNTNVNNNNKVVEEKKQEEKPQAKEHCTSTVSKAIRGLALGLLLSAGVAAAPKAAVKTEDVFVDNTVPKEIVVDSNTNKSVTKEAEESAEQKKMKEDLLIIALFGVPATYSFACIAEDITK